MFWAVLAGIGIALAGLGGVLLAWGAIMLPPAGWQAARWGADDGSDGGTFPDDHPRQRQQRKQRRMYRGAALLFVAGSALQIVAVSGAVRTDAEPVEAIAAEHDEAQVARHPDAWRVIGLSFTACTGGRGLRCDPVTPPDLDAALQPPYLAPAATVDYLDPERGQPSRMRIDFGDSDPARRWWTECVERVEIGEPLPECARPVD